ncbi:hypothetical protein PV326_009803 [Microctonus aethiopoides]|nr:hypothetical protein PV326_009803 [Microctonus aethiopoides]
MELADSEFRLQNSECAAAECCTHYSRRYAHYGAPLIISTQTFVDQVLKSDKVSSPSTICQSMNTQQILVSSTQILPIHRRDTSQIIEIVNDSLKRKSSAQLKLKKNESDKHKFTKQKVMTSRIPQLRKSAI